MPYAGIEPTSLTWREWILRGREGKVAHIRAPRHALQLVATNLQGLGAANILLFVTNSRLTCSEYIQRSNRPICLADMHPQWCPANEKLFYASLYDAFRCHKRGNIETGLWSVSLGCLRKLPTEAVATTERESRWASLNNFERNRKRGKCVWLCVCVYVQESERESESERTKAAIKCCCSYWPEIQK